MSERDPSGYESRTVTTDDDFTLGTRVFHPLGSPRGAVLIAGGTAIPQTFYRRYAERIAAHGFVATTFDYRGMGASREQKPRPSPRGTPHRGLQRWALDADTVLRDQQRFGLPIVHVGHSFGGQALGLMPSASRVIDAAVLIAAQSGFYGHWPLPQRLKMAALWHGVFPALVGIFDRLPRFAMGEALPRDVALEWAEWCRTPGYLTGALPPEKLLFRAFRAPILAYQFTDDEYAPGKSVDELLSWFTHASIEKRVRSPRRTGLKSIGHMGFFRKSGGELWSETIDWIERATMTRAAA